MVNLRRRNKRVLAIVATWVLAVISLLTWTPVYLQMVANGDNTELKFKQWGLESNSFKKIK